MSMRLPFGEAAGSASILVVDDEPDVADLFRQCFRREARQGTYVMHFAASGPEALDLACRGNPARAYRSPLRHQHARHGRSGVARQDQAKVPRSAGHDGDRVYGDDDRRRRARELGAFEFLPKPVDFDHLKAQLRQLPAATH